MFVSDGREFPKSYNMVCLYIDLKVFHFYHVFQFFLLIFLQQSRACQQYTLGLNNICAPSFVCGLCAYLSRCFNHSDITQKAQVQCTKGIWTTFIIPYCLTCSTNIFCVFVQLMILCQALKNFQSYRAPKYYIHLAPIFMLVALPQQHEINALLGSMNQC